MMKTCIERPLACSTVNVNVVVYSHDTSLALMTLQFTPGHWHTSENHYQKFLKGIYHFATGSSIYLLRDLDRQKNEFI